jgi:N-methylhydantoinase A
VGRFRKGSGLPLRIPVIEMVEIGAGGGSIAHVDVMARIEVGPESAGADPGPVCYDHGGSKPTVTDANLLLGRYDPVRFAGGTINLNEAPAREAVMTEVGGPLGLEPEMAALGIIEIVDENMANAARVHAIESGKTYEGRTLIAFGGGGPVHACRMAEKVGIRRILVPSGAGVGSAIGFLRAPVGYEIVRSLYQRLSTFDTSAVNLLLASMYDEARAVVDKGRLGSPLSETRIAFMRYVGQGHEIPVPLPTGALSKDDVAMIHSAYEVEYAKFFDRPVPGSDVEVMSYAIVLTTALPEFAGAIPLQKLTDAQPARFQVVRDTSTGAVLAWAVHDRAALASGAQIRGPAIIAEDETSTLVGPGWHAFVNSLGYIEIDRESA